MMLTQEPKDISWLRINYKRSVRAKKFCDSLPREAVRGKNNLTLRWNIILLRKDEMMQCHKRQLYPVNHEITLQSLF